MRASIYLLTAMLVLGAGCAKKDHTDTTGPAEQPTYSEPATPATPPAESADPNAAPATPPDSSTPPAETPPSDQSTPPNPPPNGNG